MTAKEYLKQMYRLNELLKSYGDELTMLRQLSNGLVSCMQEHVSGGELPGDTKTINTLAKVVELEEKIKKEMDSLILLQKDVHESIRNVKDKDEQLLLRYRYIEFLNWNEIAEKMNFSIRNIHRLHAQALQHFWSKNCHAIVNTMK